MSEGIEIKGIGDLIQKVKVRYAEEEKKARIEEKRNEEDLKAAAEQEIEIRTKLAKAKQIAEKMEKEYLELEGKIEKAKRKEIEQSTLREKDVKSGKVSLNEFIKKGKSNKQISEEVIKQTTEELEQALKAIRSKNLEILELEKEFYELQVRIRNLTLNPGRILQRSLKDVEDFLSKEMGLIVEDSYQAKINLDQLKHKLNLTTGRALSTGFRWDSMPVSEAKEIQFSPILPAALIPKLKEELAKYENSDQPVSVTYHLGIKGSIGDVSVFGIKRKERKNAG